MGRLELVEAVRRALGRVDPLYLRALLEVPRERFVRLDDRERAYEDTPLPLDDAGLATISAPHAYVLSFRAIGLKAGDAVVELGTGSGYGAALAWNVVGPTGSVKTFEIDPALAQWATGNLADLPGVRVEVADAMTCASAWDGGRKVMVTFAVEAIPEVWVDALPLGGTLVAPVGARRTDQRLVLLHKTEHGVDRTDHGAVRYVGNRSP